MAHTVHRRWVSRGSSASHGAQICLASASAPQSKQECGINVRAKTEHRFKNRLLQFDNTAAIRKYTSH